MNWGNILKDGLDSFIGIKDGVNKAKELELQREMLELQKQTYQSGSAGSGSPLGGNNSVIMIVIAAVIGFFLINK